MSEDIYKEIQSHDDEDYDYKDSKYISFLFPINFPNWIYAWQVNNYSNFRNMRNIQKLEDRKVEKRENRQKNFLLNDLIKILVLRELIGSGRRPNRPNHHRPPMPPRPGEFPPPPPRPEGRPPRF